MHTARTAHETLEFLWNNYLALCEQVDLEPYDTDCPVLCMDEQPVQLHKETRKPIPATNNHARRIDYEYERCGTACIFMFAEPLSGWREATARPQRTKVDWALEMARLLDTRCKKARKVVLVCDKPMAYHGSRLPPRKYSLTEVFWRMVVQKPIATTTINVLRNKSASKALYSTALAADSGGISRKPHAKCQVVVSIGGLTARRAQVRRAPPHCSAER